MKLGIDQVLKAHGSANAVVASIVAMGAIGAALAMSLHETPGGASPFTAEDIATQFCVTRPAESQPSPDQLPSVEASIEVPEGAPGPAFVPRVVRAKRADVLRIFVKSPVAGAVGVHGLSEILAIHPGQTVTVTFRAIYTGRFPLHFHGVDGSHYELLSVEVPPDNS
jgi:hypothetical protein